MASWVDPIDTETDPDAPLKSELAKRWDNNVIAALEGAPGAQRLALGAIEDITAGVSVRHSYTKLITSGAGLSYEFGFLQSGIIRFLGSRTVATTTSCVVTRYRNGVATSILSTGIAAPTADIDVLPFDILLIAWTTSGIDTTVTTNLQTNGENLWCANPTSTVGVTGNTFA
tara:strand:- start:777 stop:1292 length:516 start_codon:yes stop_codon:yes gene_type:complete